MPSLLTFKIKCSSALSQINWHIQVKCWSSGNEKSVSAKSCRGHSITPLPKLTVPCNVLKKHLQLKRISLKVTSLPTAVMWENSTMTAQTTQRCKLIEATLQVTSSVCPSLLTTILGILRKSLNGAFSLGIGSISPCKLH